MAVEITFPRVDMDMTSGRINTWFVKEGQLVGKGDTLFEIETDKAAMEIEAPAAGILRSVTASPGDEIQVGTTIGWIVAEGEAWSGLTERSPLIPEAPEVSATSDVPDVVEFKPNENRPTDNTRATRATPLARREAKRLGIKLETINGSGPRGRVLCRDLPSEYDSPTEDALVPIDLVAAASEPRAEKTKETPARVKRPLSSSSEDRPMPAHHGVPLLHQQWLGAATGTPVVFLHGFAGDLSTWRAVWAQSGTDYRILALDLPGHGRSDATSEASFLSLVDAVASTLRSEGVNRIHLVGHSLGGAVALGLVETAQFDIQSMCLISPAGLGAEIDGAFIAGITSATQEASLRPWLLRLVTDESFVSPGFVRQSLRGLLADGVRGFQAALAASLFADGTQTVDVRHVLGQLNMPTKVIWGLNDHIIPCKHSRALPGRVALHTLACGHMPQLEDASLVADMIKELTRAAPA